MEESGNLRSPFSDALFFTVREAEEVRQFANRIEPASSVARNQLSLFNTRGA
jgi:hypothetical protein